MKIQDILKTAIKIHKNHLRVGIPMNERTGFREAFIGSSATLAFYEHGFLCYPQFGFRGGANDAVFVNIKLGLIVLAEFKRLH